MLGELVAKIGLWVYATSYGCLALVYLMKCVIVEGRGKMFNKTKRDRPACLQNPELGIHGYLQLEDVKIHYVANGPEDKPLMLFVHGFPEFWYSWRKQLIEFSNDYRCVAIDMRGYGDSDKPSGIKNYVMEYLMKDLQQVIEALGYKRCILVAHDWGGAVAWSFTRHYPHCVDKLIVLNCPASPIFQKLLRTDKDQMKKSWYMFFFQLPVLPEIMLGLRDFSIFDDKFGRKYPEGSMIIPMTTEEIEAYKYNYSQPDAFTGPINFYRAGLRYSRRSYDLNFTVPILLIWGLKDMALGEKCPELMEKEIPGIVVRRIVDAGHFVHSDAPAQVNAIIRESLSSKNK